MINRIREIFSMICINNVFTVVSLNINKNALGFSSVYFLLRSYVKSYWINSSKLKLLQSIVIFRGLKVWTPSIEYFRACMPGDSMASNRTFHFLFQALTVVLFLNPLWCLLVLLFSTNPTKSALCQILVTYVVTYVKKKSTFKINSYNFLAVLSSISSSVDSFYKMHVHDDLIVFADKTCQSQRAKTRWKMHTYDDSAVFITLPHEKHLTIYSYSSETCH
jgi:hypothetical protein